MRFRDTILPSLVFLAALQGPTMAQSVGVSAAVNPATQGTPPGQTIRTITLGEQIIHNELIETDEGGLLQILLADGTTFTVGPSSSLTIDSFVYDPDAGTASLTASLGRGVFRFIGGQVSKSPQGVTFNTPVGTAGIRGAIADMDFGAGDGTSSYIVLRYGDEIVLEKGGQRVARIYKAGYVIVVDENGEPSVRKTPPSFTALFQRRMSGPPGSNGGAPEKPTEETVTQSGIQNTNSEYPVAANSAPTPTPRPPLEGDEVVDDANRDTIQAYLPDNGSPGPEEPEEPEEPMPEEVSARVLTANGSFGMMGIVGGSPDTDQSIQLDVNENGTQGTGELAQGPVTLPLYDDDSFTAHSVSGVSSPYGTLSGVAYSGADRFTAYLLGIGGDPTQPFYAITGTPTDVTSVFAGNGVRRYSLTQDPIQGFGLPFVTGGVNFGSAATSDLMIAEGPGGGARVFQSWLNISGTGAGQQSAIGVNVGAVDGSGFSLARRGGYRLNADGIAYTMFGDASTIAVGGSGIFGANGQNFVVSENLGTPGHFFDSPNDGLFPGGDFSTIHVGNLEGTETVTRTMSGSYSGFATGIVDMASEGAGIYTNADPDDFNVTFDPGSRSLGGTMLLNGFVWVSFGDGVDGNVQNGASAYINDDVFGAAANPNREETGWIGYDSVEYQQREGADAATYFVSSGSVEGLSDMEFMEDVGANFRCTECDFLKWGWWGTQAQLADPSAPGTESVRMSAHLGTWVIGDITQVSDLSTTEANYRGLAVGSVANGVDRYIAAGEMGMNYDFGSNVGGMDITNFDGHNFSGGMTSTASSGNATFGGYILESSSGIEGYVDGAFVNDGPGGVAAGVIGNFTAEGDGWAATGIIAGQRFEPES